MYVCIYIYICLFIHINRSALWHAPACQGQAKDTDLECAAQTPFDSESRKTCEVDAKRDSGKGL